MTTKEYIYKLSNLIAKKDNLDIKVYPYYFLGYYKSELFKKKMRLLGMNYKINELLIPWTNSAFVNDEEIHIFLSHCFTKKNIRNHELFIAELTHMIAHELGHVYQEQHEEKYSYAERLIFKLENFLIDSSLEFNKHYQEYHDNYLLEIDADLYGSIRAEKILKKLNMPKEVESLGKEKIASEIRKYNYDFEILLEEIINILRNDPEVVEANYSELLPIPLLYLKDDMKFETIENIMYINEEINNDITEVSKMIISSEIYLKELDIHSLSTEECNYLQKVLEEKKEEELKRLSYNEHLPKYPFINPEYIILLTESSLARIKRYDNYLKELEQVKEDTNVISKNRL